MKKLITLILLFICTYAFSQSDSAIKYTGVVTVDSATKEQLFIRARSWLNNNFKSSKAVLEISDKETGELSGNGILTTYFSSNIAGAKKMEAGSQFKISIWVKDNKYKYEIKNIDNVSLSNGRTNTLGTKGFGLLTSSTTSTLKWPMIRQSKMDEMLANYREKVEEEIKNTIQSLKASMASKTPDF